MRGNINTITKKKNRKRRTVDILRKTEEKSNEGKSKGQITENINEELNIKNKKIKRKRRTMDIHGKIKRKIMETDQQRQKE